MQKKKKVKEAISGKADVRVGKSGVTPEILKEIETRLKKKGVIKVRVLKSLLSQGVTTEEIAEQITSSLDAELVDVRGHVFVLLKKKQRSHRPEED